MNKEIIKRNLNSMGTTWYIAYLFNKYVNKNNEIPLKNSKTINSRVNKLPKTTEEDIEYIKFIRENTNFNNLRKNTLEMSPADADGCLTRVERVLGLI